MTVLHLLKNSYLHLLFKLINFSITNAGNHSQKTYLSQPVNSSSEWKLAGVQAPFSPRLKSAKCSPDSFPSMASLPYCPGLSLVVVPHQLS